MVDIDFVAGGDLAGAGAPVLKGYIDQARAANPNTLVVMAGDSWERPRRTPRSSTTRRRSQR